jgi:hypothetical protein
MNMGTKQTIAFVLLGNYLGVSTMIERDIWADIDKGAYEPLQPSKAYPAEINKDGRPDLVIEMKNGVKYVLLCQQDNTFLLRQDIDKQNEKALDAKIDSTLARADSSEFRTR